MIRSGDLHLAPVVLPLGLRSIVDAFTGVVPVPTEKATELLYGGALADPAVRAAVQEGLHPLADRVREIVSSVGAHGRPITSVVLDMPGGAMPGLPQALQELWPDQRVVPLESLGLHSPAEMPAVRPETAAPGRVAAVPIPTGAESSRSIAPGAAAVAAAAAIPVIAGVAAASHAATSPVTTAETAPVEVAPIGVEHPVPVAASEGAYVTPSAATAAQEHVATGSAFLAWVACLALLVLLLFMAFLLNQFRQFNNRLDTLGLRLEQVWSRQEANAPSAASQRASLVPTRTVLPVIPLTTPASAPATKLAPNTPVRPIASRPFAGVNLPGVNLPGVTGPGLLDLPVPRGGGRAGSLGGLGMGIPGLGIPGLVGGGSAGNGGGGPYLAEAPYSGPGSIPGSLALDTGSPFTPFSLPSVPSTAGSTMMAERDLAGPQTFPLPGPSGFDNAGSFPAPPSTFYAATTPMAATLTLPDVLQQAAARSLGPLAAQYREDQSDAQSQIDLSQYNLNYGIQGNFSTNTNRRVTNSNLGYSYLGLYGNYPLDVFNHRRTARGVSDAVHTQADLQVASAREGALFDAGQA
ncbi:MAG: hypothetical protein M3Y56_05315, partial [Armatimonadota bacterium]|nr:hypothetical protein [Armatimonadota bacterium]